MSAVAPPMFVVLPIPTCPYVLSPKQVNFVEVPLVESTQVVVAISPAAMEITEVYAARQPAADVAATLLE